MTTILIEREWGNMYKRHDCKDTLNAIYKKLETEHELFYYQMLAATPKEIYDNCSMIRFYECIYEYFIYKENIKEEYMLIAKGDNIIEKLYHIYLKYEHLSCDSWSDIDAILSMYIHENYHKTETE